MIQTLPAFLEFVDPFVDTRIHSALHFVTYISHDLVRTEVTRYF